MASCTTAGSRTRVPAMIVPVLPTSTTSPSPTAWCNRASTGTAEAGRGARAAGRLRGGLGPVAVVPHHLAHQVGGGVDAALLTRLHGIGQGTADEYDAHQQRDEHHKDEGDGESQPKRHATP